MYTPTQLPIIMGLTSAAALILILALSLSTPLPSLSLPLIHNYSFPAIKSFCVEYVLSMWSLFSRSKEPILITPRNLFLLVNLIILFLFVNLHLQQHAPAAGKRSSRKKRQQHTEKLIMQAGPLQGSSLEHDLAGSETAATENEALTRSLSAAAEEIPESLQTEESLTEMSAKLDQTVPAVDSDCINGSHAEQIVLDEDGQLRLIGGTTSSTVGLGDTDTIGSDAEDCESGQLRLIEYPNGSGAEKIVLEENGQLRLVEAINGSDQDKIVLEEDGRLRLIERPQLPSPRLTSRPLKSLSTGDDDYRNADDYDPNDVNNSKLNYDTHSLHKSDYDIHDSLNTNHSTNSLNDNHTDFNELSNGTLIIDCSLSNLNEVNDGTDIIDCSRAAAQNLSHVNAQNLSQVGSSRNKSSSRVRTSSTRPIRVKKSDSLDATWKAINNNKSSAASRDRKNLVRQSSKQDFKPSRGGGGGAAANGLMRASNNINNNNNNNKVRREPSISQEELNVKVESFIAKFNEQIRIQRQQSLLSYTQMVDRGA